MQILVYVKYTASDSAVYFFANFLEARYLINAKKTIHLILVFLLCGLAECILVT